MNSFWNPASRSGTTTSFAYVTEDSSVGGAYPLRKKKIKAAPIMVINAPAIKTLFKPRLLFYVAYGDAGVVKIDWSDPANPVLLDRKEVIGGAVGTAINNGRVYTAAGAGGLSVLK